MNEHGKKRGQEFLGLEVTTPALRNEVAEKRSFQPKAVQDGRLLAREFSMQFASASLRLPKHSSTVLPPKYRYKAAETPPSQERPSIGSATLDRPKQNWHYRKVGVNPWMAPS